MRLQIVLAVHTVENLFRGRGLPCERMSAGKSDDRYYPPFQHSRWVGMDDGFHAWIG
jgi:hypothetical protein